MLRAHDIPLSQCDDCLLGSIVTKSQQSAKVLNKIKIISKFLNPIFSPQVSDWNVIKLFRKLYITFQKFFKSFRSFLTISEHPKISENSENSQHLSEDCFKSFPTFSVFIPKSSDNFHCSLNNNSKSAATRRNIASNIASNGTLVAPRGRF